MFIACVVISAVLAAILLASASGKLTKQPRIVDGLPGLGVPVERIPHLAALEIAGAVGLLVGLAIPLIGIAAAIGVCLYFIGAIVFHVRADDLPGAPVPAVILVLAAVALVLRLATM
jgi:hypothetical protein